MANFNTKHDCILYGGDLCNWNEAPAQFRFAADRKRLTKLVRNADNVEIWVPSFSHGIVAQKGPILDYIKGMMAEDGHVACIFNGVSLMIFGQIDPSAVATEAEEAELG